MTTVRRNVDLSKIQFTALPNDKVLDRFRCGERQIDDWAEKCADLDRQPRARVFCAMGEEEPLAHGFYSLSMTGVSAKGFDERGAEHFTHSGFIPFIYIDYIAVREESKGNGIGTGLMVDALRRCTAVARNVALFGVALNSLNAKTTAYYRSLRFGEKSQPNMQYPLMVLPVWTLFDLEKIRAE